MENIRSIDEILKEADQIKDMDHFSRLLNELRSTEKQRPEHEVQFWHLYTSYHK